MNQFGKSNLRAARLTSDKVFDMRERYAAGATQRELGELFGMSTVQVGRIVRGESWRGSASLSKGRDPRLLVTREALDASAQRIWEATRGVQASSPPPASGEPAEEILQRKLDAHDLLKGL